MTQPVVRRTIGHNNSWTRREEVLETPDAIEVETRDQYDVNRRRVLLEEVRLVTIHREYGRAFLILNGIFLLFFGGLAIVLAMQHVTGATVFFGIVAAPFLLALAVRAALGVDVITVCGPRSKAAVRFTFRKKRARELYGRLCARIAETQRTLARQVAQETADAAPAAPSFPAPPAGDALPEPPSFATTGPLSS